MKIFKPDCPDFMDAHNLLKWSEENYTAQVQAAANHIMAHSDEYPIILLSGPSGSGKTTTAFRLEAILDAMGYETHVISMDHYFKELTPEEMVLMKQNRFDLESPARVNQELLAEQLASIAEGRPTEIPYYDFVANRSIPSGHMLTRGKKDLILLEGIHALNPDLTGMCAAIGLYVSVRTRVELPNGELMHPSLIRLLRRLIRDSRFRGSGFETIIGKYPSVERGEAKYIMPYKHRAEVEIDSFLPYELGIFRSELFDRLMAMHENDMAQTLVRLLDPVCPAPYDPDTIPTDSLLCEFLGGSRFVY